MHSITQKHYELSVKLIKLELSQVMASSTKIQFQLIQNEKSTLSNNHFKLIHNESILYETIHLSLTLGQAAIQSESAQIDIHFSNKTSTTTGLVTFPLKSSLNKKQRLTLPLQKVFLGFSCALFMEN